MGAVSDWDPTIPATSASLLSSPVRLNFGAIDDAIFDAEPTGVTGGFLFGFLIKRATATTLTVGAGMAFVSSTKRVKKKTTTTTLDITTSGVGGLDTGSVAADTWYYVWIIHETATGNISFMLSTSTTAPTNPSGWTAERPIDAWWRGDATTGLKPGYTTGRSRDRKRHWIGPFADSTKDSIFQLEGGSATTLTTVDLSTLGGIPPADITDKLFFFPSDITIVVTKSSSATEFVVNLEHSIDALAGNARAFHMGKNQLNAESGGWVLGDKNIKYKGSTASPMYIGVASYSFGV